MALKKQWVGSFTWKAIVPQKRICLIRESYETFINRENYKDEDFNVAYDG